MAEMQASLKLTSLVLQICLAAGRNKELESLLQAAKADQHKAAREADQGSHEMQRRHDAAEVAGQQAQELLKQQIKQDEETKRHQETHINELVKQIVSWLFSLARLCLLRLHQPR